MMLKITKAQGEQFLRYNKKKISYTSEDLASEFRVGTVLHVEFKGIPDKLVGTITRFVSETNTKYWVKVHFRVDDSTEDINLFGKIESWARPAQPYPM
jgi:hypothetical protein